MIDALSDDAAVEGLEPEFGTARGKRLDDARDVVADEDEARDFGVRLHRPPQRVLRILSRTKRALLRTLHNIQTSICKTYPMQWGMGCSTSRLTGLQVRWGME